MYNTHVYSSGLFYILYSRWRDLRKLVAMNHRNAMIFQPRTLIIDALAFAVMCYMIEFTDVLVAALLTIVVMHSNAHAA